MTINKVIIISALAFLSCDNKKISANKTTTEITSNKNFSLADSTKTRLKAELIEFYKTYSDTFDQKNVESNAEKFLLDFEKAKNTHGDSLTYYSDIFMGFGKLLPDTSNMVKK